jgi:hypothetical protein
LQVYAFLDFREGDLDDAEFVEFERFDLVEVLCQQEGPVL